MPYNYLRLLADKIRIGIDKFNNHPFVVKIMTNGRKQEAFTYKYDGLKLLIWTDTKSYYVMVPLTSFIRWANHGGYRNLSEEELLNRWKDKPNHSIPEFLMRKYLTEHRNRWVEYEN